MEGINSSVDKGLSPFLGEGSTSWPRVVLIRTIFVVLTGIAVLAYAGPVAAQPFGSPPCNTNGCEDGCFVLGPGSNGYNSCMARCSSGSTSDESLIESAESAFLDDVRRFPRADDELLREGYRACSLLSQGVDREELAAAFSRNTGQTMSDSTYFVTRSMVRLCPVM